MAVDQMTPAADGNRAWGDDWRRFVAFFNLFTTKGDLVVGGASARERLAAGTNGQVLTADSTSSTGLSYTAGGALVTRNTQTVSYTLVLADAGKVIDMNSASATVLTVPTNASVAFPIDTVIDVRQLGAGQVTVAGSGVTLDKPGTLTTRAQFSRLSLHKIGTDRWIVDGDSS